MGETKSFRGNCMNLQPSSDPLTNLIYQQIKRAIQICLDNECFGAATILIYSGIDTMSSLTIPEGQNVTRSDFVRWTQKYISLCKEYAVSGDELYSARCAMLHSYSTDSDMTRNGRCRQIAYMDNSVPPVRFDPSVSNDLVLISVSGLAKVFSDGIDRFLIDVFSNPTTASLAENRLKLTCQMYMTKELQT